MEIKIGVANKRAKSFDDPVIVCGNSDYTIRFTFDAEWAETTAKTARFAYVRNNGVEYQDAVFTGDTVVVPVLANVTEVLVGVFAGDLRTTTPARITCEPSIRCGTGAPADPTPSQYDQIMQMLENIAASGGAIVKTDNTLKLDEHGRLGVNTASEVEKDNTLPITSAAVHTTVGNIEILLKTI